MKSIDRNHGSFIFSFDFELYWGIHHNRTVESYGAHLMMVKENFSRILHLFSRYGAHFTCASVGMLYHSGLLDLLNHEPKGKPKYADDSFNPYSKFEGLHQIDTVYLFAPELLEMIRREGHEMATHTYSHYFCMEDGSSLGTFEIDLRKAIELGRMFGDDFVSIVFPRNQYKQEHLDICRKLGIKAYRGNQNSKLYAKSPNRFVALLKKPLRLLDSYINVSGHNCFDVGRNLEEECLDIPASFFLRPANSGNRFAERIKMKRIKESMTYAAKNSLCCHVWCHPHNIYSKNDMGNLEEILRHFEKLHSRFGMQSNTMRDFLK